MDGERPCKIVLRFLGSSLDVTDDSQVVEDLRQGRIRLEQAEQETFGLFDLTLGKEGLGVSFHVFYHGRFGYEEGLLLTPGATNPRRMLIRQAPPPSLGDQ